MVSKLQRSFPKKIEENEQNFIWLCWDMNAGTNHLRSVVGPTIQAYGRMSLKDDLRSVLQCFTVNQCLHWGRWQYGYPRGTQGWLGVWERVVWSVRIIQQLKVLLASSSVIRWWLCTKLTKIGRPKFYADEMTTPTKGDWHSFLAWTLSKFNYTTSVTNKQTNHQCCTNQPWLVPRLADSRFSLAS